MEVSLAVVRGAPHVHAVVQLPTTLSLKAVAMDVPLAILSAVSHDVVCSPIFHRPRGAVVTEPDTTYTIKGAVLVAVLSPDVPPVHVDDCKDERNCQNKIAARTKQN